tara:strand:+ start:94 stop:429 length:336 start_codon:yes stop_codon:yes gene_type:complete
MKTKVKQWLRKVIKQNIGSVKGRKVEFKVNHSIIVNPMDKFHFMLDEDCNNVWGGEMVFSYDDMVEHIMRNKIGYFETHCSIPSQDYEVDYDKCSDYIKFNLNEISKTERK